MSTTNEIGQKVINVIAKELDCEMEKVKPEANFIKDLGMDSLDATGMMMALEEEFDIKIPEKEAEKMKTVQDAIDFVSTQVA